MLLDAQSILSFARDLKTHCVLLFSRKNWAIRLAGLVPKKKKKQEDPQKSKKGKKKTLTRRASADGYFEFHNHCTTDQGIDVRDRRTSKATGSVHRAIVPYSPLISRRFYDWPPNPSLSKVDICGET